MSAFHQETPHIGGNLEIPTALAGISGAVIDLAEPDPAQLVLGDIARGCAMQVRYAGQLTAFYSVAEHCVLVHDLVKLKYPAADAGVLRYALLHDAQEAFIGDATSPLKRAMGAGNGYARVEGALERAIQERFDLPNVSAPLKATIKDADLHARFLEASRLQPAEEVWRTRPDLIDLPRGISCAFGLSWQVAEAMFLQVAAGLGLE